MSQTPPNSGWQGGPQGPGQNWNGQQPPQGPPPGYQGNGPQQGFGQQPTQNFNAPTQNFGQQPTQNFGQQPPQNFGPQQGQSFGPQQGQNFGPQQGQNFGPQQGQNSGPQPGQGGGAPVKPKSKVKYIVAGVVAVALIAAGVGAGLFFFKGSTPAAAKGLPANVAGAIEVNLAPSNADKLAVKSIIEKYPSLKPSEDIGGDYKKALYTALVQSSSDAPAYSEIEPWLGDSIALGFVGSSQEDIGDGRNIVAAIETKDKGKAEAFMKKEAKDAKVQFIDNLMIVTQSDSTISVNDIKKNSLADSADYKSDMAKLGGGNLVTGWFGSALFDAAIKSAEEQGGFAGTGTFDPASMKGAHGAFGLKASDNKLSIKYATQTPNAPEIKSNDISALAKDMPGDALVVLAGGTSEPQFKALWELVESQPNGVESLNQLGIGSVDDLKALLGTQMAVSVGLDGQNPKVGAKLITDNPEKQKQIFDKVQEAMGQSQEFPLSTAQDGKTGIVAFGQSTDDVVKPSSKIGDLEGFKKVVEGKADGIFYVNIEGLKSQSFYQDTIGSSGEFQEVLDPITSIGLVGNYASDHYQEGFMHVTFK